MPRVPKADTRLVLSQPDLRRCDRQRARSSTAPSPTAASSETSSACAGFVFEDPRLPRCLRGIQQWDKDVVHHLRGAFAFALWDAGRERLMLARDRFGEKPLYVCEQRRLAVFRLRNRARCLRMPGIAAQPDPGAVHDYLAYRYVPAPRTLISGVRKLMPGTYALWQFGRLREVRYWFRPDRAAAAACL